MTYCMCFFTWPTFKQWSKECVCEKNELQESTWQFIYQTLCMNGSFWLNLQCYNQPSNNNPNFNGHPPIFVENPFIAKTSPYNVCLNTTESVMHFKGHVLLSRTSLNVASRAPERCWRSATSRFHPFRERCFPFNVARRGWSVGKGARRGMGRGAKKLLVCVAMPCCSSHVSTSELWWNMRDSRRTVARDDTAAQQISQMREDGQIWGDGVTTSKRVVRGDKLDSLHIHASAHQKNQGEFLHVIIWSHLVVQQIVLCSFWFAVHEVCCCCPLSTRGEGCKWLEHVWHLPLQTHSLALAS